ncbi:MAG: alpha-L-fucosidase [Pirellulales bacterium]|nr:alpha-L-fucosidase [Pirellulales bacterium]
MCRRKTLIRCVAIFCAIGITPVCLSVGFAADSNSPKENRDYLKAKPEVVKAWQDMRFGMFVCWGPVTLTGKEIGWSRGAPRGGEFRVREGQGETPVEIYDNLYKKWRPDKFDARKWVKVAQDAGCKYMIFLVKHHDGYCLYDTKLTDYCSTGPEAAWKHDVMADIAEACHEAGLKLIVYYSQPDWHHPDYRTKNHHRYIKFLHGQVREILTNYGRIDGFWFDLGGKPQDWDSENLFKMMRTLQPWLIINNRCGLRGDYDTPEQKFGAFQLDRPWETCMTLGMQWSWKPDDRIKSLKECIDALVTCVGRNGNLALNTNPMPDGRIEPRQVERFREIGGWLKENGDSIYGTRGGPFWGLNCLSTRKNNTIYVHVLKWDEDVLVLPPIEKKIVSHSLMTGGKAQVKQTHEGIAIRVPAEHRNELDTIIALELDGLAADLKPQRVSWGSLTFCRPVKASAKYNKVQRYVRRYEPDKAVDGDPRSGWTVNPDVKSAWLEVDLEKEAAFDRAVINEPLGRVVSFELQVKDGDAWKTFHSGQKIGRELEIQFPATTGQCVRLFVTDAVGNPMINEFQLFRTKRDPR